MSRVRAASRPGALLALVAAAGLAAGAALPRAAEPAPTGAALGNEEIVRMVANGVAEADILAAISARPCAFDVSDDMVDELKIAGVPAAVIAAMRTRVAQASPQPPPPERPRRDTTRLAVTFSSLGAHTLHAPTFADEATKHRLKLSRELADREIHDLAVFLACTTAEHVPDQWRQKSPLGRDMNLGLRHEMLAFIPGDTPAGKKPRVSLPDRIEADVDDAEPHDLVLGVAALIGDRWIQVAVGSLANTKVIAGSKPLSAHISAGPEPLSYAITLTAPAR